MLKFVLLLFLVIFVIVRLLNFFVRILLTGRPRQNTEKESSLHVDNPQESTKKTDEQGEYIDYEEIKNCDK